MRVAMFSTKPYDRRSFEARNAEFGHELHFLEPRLGPETVPLAAGFPAVCLFVNDACDAQTLELLHLLRVILDRSSRGMARSKAAYPREAQSRDPLAHDVDVDLPSSRWIGAASMRRRSRRGEVPRAHASSPCRCTTGSPRRPWRFRDQTALNSPIFWLARFRGSLLQPIRNAQAAD